MRILLDSHVFLWLAFQPVRIPSSLRPILVDPENELLLSVAAVWELQIKAQAGKLSLEAPLAAVVAKQRDSLGINVINVN